MSVLTYIQAVYNSASNCVAYIYTFIVTLVDINFKAVTVTVDTFQDILTMITNVYNVISSLLANVLSSAFDFIVEIFSLLHAFALVVYKFIVFLWSVICSAYQCVEILIYLVISNTVWLLSLLSSGAYSSKDIILEAWGIISRYAAMAFRHLIAGFAVIGSSGADTLLFICKTVKWALTSFWSNIDSGMMAFAESIRYITDTVYFGMYDMMYLRRETYMGLLICLLIFIVIANLYKGLKRRGMTFPVIHENFDVRYARARPNFGFDFSDNDEDETDENDNDSDITVASSEPDDDDDEVDEYEVDDLTTDDELSDSDSTASIDIQLPPVNSGSYNLRRSTTPSRLDVHTSEDFQKEIEKEKEKIKCVVCQDNEKSVLILPCRHLCLCLHCGNTIARSRNVERRVCPLCRKKIETIMNVYT